MNSTLAQEKHGRHEGRPSTTPRSLLPPFLLLATIGFLWFMLCRQLSYEWSANEQYSYGWFVPFFAAFLFWLRFEDAPHLRSSYRLSVNGSSEAVSAAHKKLITIGAIIALAILAPIRLFEVANPDWRPLSWVHALAVVGYSLLVIGYWGGRRAVRHFAFPVCFILVAVPWITPIEGPLVQGLMRLVAAVAAETLTLFGIPAQLEGSVIRVSNGLVGVSEACSGVRSLQTSLMIGLLFGELKRLTVARRVALVAAALAIALLANFGRAFFLVWIAATQNLAAVERWHDIAGYAIVGAVFLGTVGIAAAMAKVESVKAKGERNFRAAMRQPATDLRPPTSDLRLPPSLLLLSTLAFLLLTESAVSLWYRWHERSLVPTTAWSVQWPENAPNFRALPVDAHTREMLRYDAGREASWAVPDVIRPADFRAEPVSTERVGKAILYLFRWQPGTATVLRARAHRPDICLPVVGWKPTGPANLHLYAVTDDFSLPFQQFSFVHEEPGTRTLYAETFFCLREDRVRPGTENRNDLIPFSHWSIPERWEAVRRGLRNPGQQVLEFVLLTHHPLTQKEAREGFAGLVPRLVKEDN